MPRTGLVGPCGARGRSEVTGGQAGAFSLTATPILRYMGDYPSRQAWTSVELTDQIFSLALQESALQDEVYCQILKQLTHNTTRSAGDKKGPEGTRLRAQAPSGFTVAPEAVTSVQLMGAASLPGTDSSIEKAGPSSVLLTSWGWSEQGGKRTCLGPCLLLPFLLCDLGMSWAL